MIRTMAYSVQVIPLLHYIIHHMTYVTGLQTFHNCTIILYYSRDVYEDILMYGTYICFNNIKQYM